MAITPYEQALIQKLCPAVESKNLIKFWYEDEDSDKRDWRKVEPHLIGLHKTSGNAVLRAWFLPSQEQRIKGWRGGWKLYRLLNISREEILAEKYLKTRPGYNPNDSEMSFIYCRTQITT